MKNLLISKSFNYEIVDFTLLWQSNTYRLEGGRFILPSYKNILITCKIVYHKPKIMARVQLYLIMTSPRSIHAGLPYQLPVISVQYY